MGLSTCWFIVENKAYFGSIFGTNVYASAYKLGWLKWLKLSKDGLYHILLVVSPRISPQPILKQVLGPWIMIFEFLENFVISVKV